MFAAAKVDGSGAISSCRGKRDVMSPLSLSPSLASLFLRRVMSRRERTGLFLARILLSSFSLFSCNSRLPLHLSLSPFLPFSFSLSLNLSLSFILFLSLSHSTSLFFLSPFPRSSSSSLIPFPLSFLSLFLLPSFTPPSPFPSPHPPTLPQHGPSVT